MSVRTSVLGQLARRRPVPGARRRLGHAAVRAAFLDLAAGQRDGDRRAGPSGCSTWRWWTRTPLSSQPDQTRVPGCAAPSTTVPRPGRAARSWSGARASPAAPGRRRGRRGRADQLGSRTARPRSTGSVRDEDEARAGPSAAAKARSSTSAAVMPGRSWRDSSSRCGRRRCSARGASPPSLIRRMSARAAGGSAPAPPPARPRPGARRGRPRAPAP